MNAKTVEPLPCPFCGKAPNVGVALFNAGWVAECSNLRCPAFPRVLGPTRAIAIRRWNKRA